MGSALPVRPNNPMLTITSSTPHCDTRTLGTTSKCRMRFQGVVSGQLRRISSVLLCTRRAPQALQGACVCSPRLSPLCNVQSIRTIETNMWSPLPCNPTKLTTTTARCSAHHGPFRRTAMISSYPKKRNALSPVASDLVASSKRKSNNVEAHLAGVANRGSPHHRTGMRSCPSCPRARMTLIRGATCSRRPCACCLASHQRNQQAALLCG